MRWELRQRVAQNTKWIMQYVRKTRRHPHMYRLHAAGESWWVSGLKCPPDYSQENAMYIVFSLYLPHDISLSKMMARPACKMLAASISIVTRTGDRGKGEVSQNKEKKSLFPPKWNPKI